MGGIRYYLHIHEDAEADLIAIGQADAQTMADLAVVLEEVGDDQDLLDRLSQHNFEDPHNPEWPQKLSISRWLKQWNAGRNLWRLKNLDLESDGLRYRVIYAYLPKKRTYMVLAVLLRSAIDYDNPRHPNVKRILASYDEIA